MRVPLKNSPFERTTFLKWASLKETLKKVFLVQDGEGGEDEVQAQLRAPTLW